MQSEIMPRAEIQAELISGNIVTPVPAALRPGAMFRRPVPGAVALPVVVSLPGAPLLPSPLLLPRSRLLLRAIRLCPLRLLSARLRLLWLRPLRPLPLLLLRWLNTGLPLLLIALTRLVRPLRRRLLRGPRRLLLRRRRARTRLRLLRIGLRLLLRPRLRLLLLPPGRLLLLGLRWLRTFRAALLVPVGLTLAIAPVATIALCLDRGCPAKKQENRDRTRQWDEFHDSFIRT